MSVVNNVQYQENEVYIKNSLDFDEVSFYYIHEKDTLPAGADKKKLDASIPGKPTFHFAK